MGTKTKELLANTLVNLMENEYLDKIKVTALAKACGINRQTFYYHFNDMYELVYWMLNNESEQLLASVQDQADIVQIFLVFETYMSKNSKTIQNVYYSLSRDVLQRFLLDKTSDILRRYIVLQGYARDIDATVVERVVQFYKHAYVGYVLEWIRCGMTVDTSLPKDKIALLLGESLRREVLGLEGILQSNRHYQSKREA
ncbi:MAG: TetR/AcrR family transcriptional regulator C-terminal domain-containing protein [Spirochaetia bacterium]|jgi:AcrR family transcriptional regulator|nr:TetR/AcrR family transcriptional regulator C-terminal domain-containing protein [Spirochaetia bacterium]